MENSEKRSIWKYFKLDGMLPLVTAFFLLFSYLNEYQFYRGYGIRIYSYLETMDLIMIVFSDIRLYMLWVFVAIAYYVVEDLASTGRNDLTLAKLVNQRTGKAASEHLTLVFSFCLVLVGLSLVLSGSSSTIAYIAIVIIISVLGVLCYKAVLYFFNVANDGGMIVFVLVFVGMSFSMGVSTIVNIRAKVRWEMVKSEGKGIVIYFDDGGRIETDENRILLGETRNNLFLYFIDQERVQVINRDKVEIVSYPKRKVVNLFEYTPENK